MYKKGYALKAVDFVVVGLALALTGFSSFFVYAKPGPDERVIVQGPYRSWVFPLDAEEQVTVTGSLGDTVVEIHEQEVRVVSSPCDNQICVAAGHIRRAGEWAACLPNGVFVLIEGRGHGGGEIDGSVW
ncbi:hypothetical protein AGMMS49991_11300 [Spirochaetia bacterium]|nr:hypothetical protein AGMMS49991_11300 [Spirochaetia bacterium]